eukprot:Ihof_evm24s40 gene=Ihof_evmTU24s40
MQWTVVFGITALEIILFFVLCIPLPATSRHNILRSLLHVSAPLKPAFILTILFLIVMLGDSAMRYYDMLDRIQQARSNATAGSDYYLKMQLFLAERNMHLAFFSLFLLFVLWRFMQMIRELVNAEVMRKQAEGSSKAVGHLMEQLLEAENDSKGKSQSEEEKKQVSQEKEKVEKDLDVLKKQNEGTQREYMALLDELNQMQ